MSDDKWLRIDERTDVLASLDHAISNLDATCQTPAAWKWVILSLHNAIQGLMVCNLSGTAQIGALRKDVAREWLSWNQKVRNGEIQHIDTTNTAGMPVSPILRADDTPPQERLATAAELFERLYSEDIRLESAGGIVDISENERASFNKLNELRNDFVHFKPRGWSIELTGMSEILCDMTCVMSRLVADEWTVRHFEDAERKKLLSYLDALKKMVASMARTET